MSQVFKPNMKIYADSEHLQYECTSSLFRTQRPDIVIKIDDELTIIELTCFFETNTNKSREHKTNRYKNLNDQLLIPCNKFAVIFLEITTMGFASKKSFTPVYQIY